MNSQDNVSLYFVFKIWINKIMKLNMCKQQILTENWKSSIWVIPQYSNFSFWLTTFKRVYVVT